MIRSVWRRSYPVTAALVAASLIILLSSCGVPLAPGYQAQKETLTVHFVSGAPPHLAIRAEYRLVNTGNGPINSFDVLLPSEAGFGLANRHAEIDGKEVALEPETAATSGSFWRISLPSPWRQKEKLNLALAYDLAARSPQDPRIFAAASTFYLNDSGWLPVLQGFKALFSATPPRPDPTELHVIVPADFRVTASGQPRGAKKHGGEMEFQFRIRKADFAPYVLAGQYQEQKVSTDGLTVAIWTSKPIPADRAQKTVTQIAAATNFYVKNLGPLPRSMKTIYDVNLPGDVGRKDGSWEAFEASLLPGVVYNWVLDPGKSFWAKLGNGFATSFGLWQLAFAWFDHVVQSRPEAWMLTEGLTAFASNILGESNGSSASRIDTIASDLSDYDSDRTNAVEKPILSLAPADPQQQLQIGGDKIELFYFALEDKCGQQNVTHAIAHMVYALHGQQYGYPEFRAALEQECHQNLADFFHTWLAQPGIPSDFRARYRNSGAVK